MALRLVRCRFCNIAELDTNGNKKVSIHGEVGEAEGVTHSGHEEGVRYDDTTVVSPCFLEFQASE